MNPTTDSVMASLDTSLDEEEETVPGTLEEGANFSEQLQEVAKSSKPGVERPGSLERLTEGQTHKELADEKKERHSCSWRH